MEIKTGLSFDDVLLVPQHSDIDSRSKVDLTVKLPKGIIVRNPIVPANMKTVTAYDMAETMYKMGGLSIIHRFMPIEDQFDLMKTLAFRNIRGENPLNYVGVSIGVKEEDKKNLNTFVGSGTTIICIDIAHGDSTMCEDMCQYVSKKYPQCLLIAGNVATGYGARRLWEAGADVVKVGIGPGSLCTTRIETGAGVPQFSALMEVADMQKSLLELEKTKYYPNEHHLKRTYPFIADGGIKNSGDIVKALCFADMVMAGNIFAGTDEAPGEIKWSGGNTYKSYVGSSTHKTNHIEGIAAVVPTKGPAKNVMERLLEGVRSGCSYQGAINLTELKECPTFIRMTTSGLIESHPHDVVLK